VSDFKQCACCRLVKTVNSFWPHRGVGHTSTRQPYCMDCNRETRRNWRHRKRLGPAWAANDDDRKRAGLLFVPIGTESRRRVA